MKAQLTIRIPEDLDREVSSLANRLRLKRSDIVRMALEKLVTELRQPPQDYPYDKVKDLLGSIASGIPDLGENHREHLLTRFNKDA